MNERVQMSQGEFPVTVQKVYVLQPSSFLQKKFADNSLKFLRDDIKYKVSSKFILIPSLLVFVL